MNNIERDHEQPTPGDIKFLRALRIELRKEAMAYYAKKIGTVNQTLFLDIKPLMYDYFGLEE